MMTRQLDEAFNWLILILSTIAGALLQYPELYPSPPYPLPKGGVLIISPRSLAHIRFLVFPILIVVMLWLWGLLTRKTGTQAVLKSFSWVFAFMILIADVVLLLFSSVSPYLVGGEGPKGIDLLFILLVLIFFSPFYLSLIINLRVVRPIMRDMYKDSTFLKEPFWQFNLYFWTALFYYFYYFVFIGIG